MSKSMAIEGVMKIFLMVAVIIVGMSFLMKAFGIDLFGWLMEKFGGLNEPTYGKILYIKMDPDKDELFAFFLAQEKDKIQEAEIRVGPKIGQPIKSYFMPDALPENKCVIYTVDENDDFGGFGWDIRDEGFYYYVSPGAIIQDTCDSLENCLPNILVEKDCDGVVFPIALENPSVEDCYKKSKGNFRFVNCISGGSDGRCDSKDDLAVEKETFSTSYNFKGFCDAEKLTSKCNILVRGEYRIKYGLICGDDGKWQACNKKQYESGETVFGAPCTPVGDKYEWDIEQLQAGEFKIELNDLIEAIDVVYAKVTVTNLSPIVQECKLEFRYTPKDFTVLVDTFNLKIGETSKVLEKGNWKKDVAEDGVNTFEAGCNGNFVSLAKFCSEGKKMENEKCVD